MNAQRKRQRATEHVEHEERVSGVYLVTPPGRVARRGSTRLEPPSPPAEPTFRRGRSNRGDA
jgi:hypothetical protein